MRRLIVYAAGVLLLTPGAPAPAANVCVLGGSYNHGCAPSDYTVCGGCFPSGTPNASVCLSQGDATGDRVCAAVTFPGTGSLVCVGCNQLTTDSTCTAAGAENCAWDGSSCAYVNRTGATTPSTDSSGAVCASATSSGNPTIAGNTRAPVTPSILQTLPPTAANAPAPLSFSLGVAGGDAHTWMTIAETYRVPTNGHTLRLTMMRRPDNTGAPDNGNIAYFDNVTLLYSGCAGTTTRCSTLRGVNQVVDAEAPPTTVNWQVNPATSRFITSIGLGTHITDVFVVSPNNAATITQEVPVVTGTTAVTVAFQLKNTASNSVRNGIVFGQWVTTPTSAPTLGATHSPIDPPIYPPVSYGGTYPPTAAVPAVPLQFVIFPDPTQTRPNQWLQLAATFRVPSFAVGLDLMLARKDTGQPESNNVAYFDNVTATYSDCASNDRSTPCNQAFGRNLIVGGDALPSGGVWRADPIGNSQVSNLGNDRVFALSFDHAQHPNNLTQRVPVLGDSRAVTVFAQVYNTVGNTGIFGYGVVRGYWILSTQAPSTIAPTSRPTPRPTQSVAPTSEAPTGQRVPTPAVTRAPAGIVANTVPPTAPPSVSAVFEVRPTDRSLAPGRWLHLSVTAPLLPGASTLRVALARNFSGNFPVERDTASNVVYFTNLSTVFACNPNTFCSNGLGRGVDVLVNGAAGVTSESEAGSGWTGVPSTFVVRAVGTAPPRLAFVLSSNTLFPAGMTQDVSVPPGANAVTVEGYIYNTVANLGVEGTGYIKGEWILATQPPSFAPTQSDAPTAAPTLHNRACEQPGNTPSVTGLQPSTAAVGGAVTVTGVFQRGNLARAVCFWWHDEIPYASYETGAVTRAGVQCTVPTPPALGVAVNVSVAVWVEGVDTQFSETCMSHSNDTGAFATFQYPGTTAPTVAPTVGPASAGPNGFYATGLLPTGNGSCSACLSCPSGSLRPCTATIVTNVACRDPTATTNTPAPSAQPRCTCPALFSPAEMGLPGTLPYFPESLCGSAVSVPCYQYNLTNHGRGRVTLRCGPAGLWNYSTWDASQCARSTLRDLVDTSRLVRSTDGVRTRLLQPRTMASIGSVVDALDNTLLVGSRDLSRMSDWVTTLVETTSAQNITVSCSVGTRLVSAIYKLMLVSDLVQRRRTGGFYLAELSLTLALSNGASDASALSVAVSEAINRYTQVLRSTGALTTNTTSGFAGFNWTATCVSEDSDQQCPQHASVSNYGCEIETTWGSDVNLAARSAFWLPFQTFFTGRELRAAIQRQMRPLDVTVRVRDPLAVRSFQPTVQNFGPLLAALAPFILQPGSSVSVRGARNGLLLRADNCSRLAAASGPISLNFTDALVVSPSGCGEVPSLDVFNVTQQPEEVAILTEVGFLNTSSVGGVASAVVTTATPAPTAIAELDSVSIDSATLRRFYNCQPGGSASLLPGPGNLGQSFSIYSPVDFLRLLKSGRRRRGVTEAESLRTELVVGGGGGRAPREVLSRVISLSLGGEDTFPSTGTLDPPALLTFTGLPPQSNHTCAFYSFSDDAFRTDGVELVSVSSDGTTIVCSTTHTTNFAVLTNVDGSAGTTNNGNQVPEDHARALSIIMYIGLVVSVVCYIAIIVTYLTHRKLLTLGKSVLCHICGTLTLGQTAFVVGVIVATTSSPSDETCTSLGVLAHYFLLSAFGWMLCEAVFMHTNFTAVFAAFVRNEKDSARKYAAFGYGAPLVVVIATLASVPDAYTRHSGSHCFLSAEDGAIWAFVGPMIAILASNLIMLVRVVLVVSRANVRKSSSMSPTDEKRYVTRVRTKRALHASISFFFLLGIGWIFGVFAVGEASLFFQYVFSGVLILQGLCLFYFHCYSDSEARAAWRGNRRKSSATSAGMVRGGRRHVPPTKSAPTSSTEVFSKPIASRLVVAPPGGGSSNDVVPPDGAYLTVLDNTNTRSTEQTSGASGGSGASGDSGGSMEKRGSDPEVVIMSTAEHSDPATSFGSENDEPPTPRRGTNEMFAL